MGDSKIQWTNKTWNPVRGCSRVSEGCRFCYAERQATRFSKPGEPFHEFVTNVNGHPAWTGKVELVEWHLEDPLHWKKSCKIFVNSMSDLFHEALPDEALDRIFAVMALCPQHQFQVLTKRPERMLRYFADEVSPYYFACTRVEKLARQIASDRGMNQGSVITEWPLPNVWLGVSVENQQTADERIPLLLRTPAAIRFVSYEPAIGPVDFNWWVRESVSSIDYAQRVGYDARHGAADRLDWIIVGGESGPGARPFDVQWARNTVAQCKAAGTACFVKQLGARVIQDGEHRKKADKKGGDMSEWPHDVRVREYPE